MAKRRKLDVAFAIPMQHGNDIAADSPLRALNIPASTAIAATSTAPKFFDKIPAEIRIMIYEFAYSGEEPLKIKATWPVRPRNCPLNRLMASKQWFNETIEIFARLTVFSCSGIPALDEVTYRLPEYITSALTSLVLYTHDRKRDVLSYDSEDRKFEVREICARLPKLKNLRVELHWWRRYLGFETSQGRDFGKFLDFYQIGGLLAFRGLQSVEIAIEPKELREGHRTDWDLCAPNVMNALKEQVYLPQ